MVMQDNSAKVIEQLNEKIVIQNDKILCLEQQNAELNAKLKWYEEQVLLSRQKQFGASSEKTIPEQLNLFNEAEDSANPKLEEPTVETITYQRKKKQAGQREDKLKDLPVEVIEYRLEEHEQVCPYCQGPLHEMSTQVRQEIKIIPAQAKVVKHVQDKTPIIKAGMPNPILPGSLASPSIVAYIIDQKYTNSMPLYRQEKQLSRLGVELSRQTMSNWLLNTADPDDYRNIYIIETGLQIAA